MTDYRINLPGCPGIDPAAQAAMWNAFSALLEHELSGAKVLVTVYSDGKTSCCTVRSGRCPTIPRMRIGWLGRLPLH
jgi:hypothetical protein